METLRSLESAVFSPDYSASAIISRSAFLYQQEAAAGGLLGGWSLEGKHSNTDAY
ncbi:MAG: hypothetical protein JXB62_10490 [Pirellulales bacterium]|nr:hypothetical protein [Pirellulales bacterium]